MDDKKMSDFLKMVAEKLTETTDDFFDEPEGKPLTVRDVLTDFKIYADETFEGEAEMIGDAVVVTFYNGQRFRIIVEEMPPVLRIVD